MAKIGVAWLEPERDVGKTTFIAVRDLTCDRTKDLPAGTVVKAKWRSSGRSYKARLLNNLMAKKTTKKSKSAGTGNSLNGTSEVTTQNFVSLADDGPREIQTASENTLDDNSSECGIQEMKKTESEQLQPRELYSESDSEDDVPLITRRDIYPSGCSGNCRNSVEVIQREISEMKSELLRNFRDTTENLQREISQLKSELLSMKTEQVTKNDKMMEKLDTIINTMFQSQKTSDETLSVIKGRITAKAANKPRTSDANASPTVSACHEIKRSQPVFGNFEGNTIVAYANERKVLSIHREKYIEMFDDSNTASSFLRKLLRQRFSDQELAESNFHGGEVTSVTGLTKKKCLDREVVLAILAQVEMEFSGSTQGKGAFGKLRETINAVCRSAAYQLRKA